MTLLIIGVGLVILVFFTAGHHLDITTLTQRIKRLEFLAEKDCDKGLASSRICERGTHACNVRHGV